MGSTAASTPLGSKDQPQLSVEQWIEAFDPFVLECLPRSWERHSVHLREGDSVHFEFACKGGDIDFTVTFVPDRVRDQIVAEPGDIGDDDELSRSSSDDALNSRASPPSRTQSLHLLAFQDNGGLQRSYTGYLQPSDDDTDDGYGPGLLHDDDEDSSLGSDSEDHSKMRLYNGREGGLNLNVNGHSRLDPSWKFGFGLPPSIRTRSAQLGILPKRHSFYHSAAAGSVGAAFTPESDSVDDTHGECKPQVIVPTKKFNVGQEVFRETYRAERSGMYYFTWYNSHLFGSPIRIYAIIMRF